MAQARTASILRGIAAAGGLYIHDLRGVGVKGTINGNEWAGGQLYEGLSKDWYRLKKSGLENGSVIDVKSAFDEVFK